MDSSNISSDEYGKDLRKRMGEWPALPVMVPPKNLIFSVRLPEDIRGWLDDLVERKVFFSVGEAMRYYLRNAKDHYPYNR